MGTSGTRGMGLARVRPNMALQPTPTAAVPVSLASAVPSGGRG